jgi:hypothetical protein
MRYHITICPSTWYDGTYRIFYQLAEMLRDYLLDRGHIAYISRYTYTDQDTQCIFFAANMSSDYVPRTAIVVDMEQHHDSRQELQGYIDKLQQHYVWTYNQYNQQWLHKHGIEAELIRFCYYRTLERPIIPTDKDIDVLYIGGSGGPRRERILPLLKPKPVIVSNKWGAELEQLIRRAKIIINVSQFDFHLLPVARIMPFLALGAFIISDPFLDADEYSYLLPGLVQTTDMQGSIDYYLEHQQEREHIASLGYKLVTSQTMKVPSTIIDASQRKEELHELMNMYKQCGYVPLTASRILCRTHQLGVWSLIGSRYLTQGTIYVEEEIGPDKVGSLDIKLYHGEEVDVIIHELPW